MVTDAATAYITECADREGMDHAVRLRIHAGGCSGLEYSIDLVPTGTPPDPDEREIQTNGVRVLLDLKSAIYVSGSVVDYTASLMRSGFVIKNPNATTSCSCGDSFGV
ncbi:MAG: iron-sulfur cluster assembly accessory protein [Thermoleophilia bacterium]|nr:iron-sulfur cluster assembly accessory protein [Thermoleophilia bacterium]